MEKLQWFERKFSFNAPVGMLPFYLERLEGTVVRIENKTKAASEEQLSLRWHNKWSVKENIGHLAEVDEVGLKRIDEMIMGTSPMSPAVFEPKPYHEWELNKVIAYFRMTRMKNLQRYKSLQFDDLNKAALHPRLK